MQSTPEEGDRNSTIQGILWNIISRFSRRDTKRDRESEREREIKRERERQRDRERERGAPHIC